MINQNPVREAVTKLLDVPLSFLSANHVGGIPPTVEPVPVLDEDVLVSYLMARIDAPGLTIIDGPPFSRKTWLLERVHGRSFVLDAGRVSWEFHKMTLTELFERVPVAVVDEAQCVPTRLWPKIVPWDFEILPQPRLTVALQQAAALPSSMVQSCLAAGHPVTHVSLQKLDARNPRLMGTVRQLTSMADDWEWLRHEPQAADMKRRQR